MIASLKPFFRFFVFLLLIPVSLAGLVFLVLVAANWFDEALDPQTEIWLKPTVASVPPAENAYFALISLDAQVDEPRMAGINVVAAYRRIAAESTSLDKESVEARYAAARRDILKPAEVSLDELKKCAEDCYRQLRDDRQQLQQLAKKFATQRQRYAAMLDMPAYSEETVFDYAAPALRAGFDFRLGLLYLGDVVDLLEHGETLAAYEQWARYQMFWERVAAGSQSLIGVVLATANIQRGQLLLGQMLAMHPESRAVARRLALPALEQSAGLQKAWGRAVIGEFHHFAEVMTKLEHSTARDGTTMEKTRNIFLKTNASINLARRMNEHEISPAAWPLADHPQQAGIDQDDICQTFWRASILRNPIGQIMACVSDPKHSRQKYLDRIKLATEEALALRVRLTAD